MALLITSGLQCIYSSVQCSTMAEPVRVSAPIENAFGDYAVHPGIL